MPKRTVDALALAVDAMAWSEDESLAPDACPWFFAKAQAYATIAQAQAQREQNKQLERIADALENISGAYSIDLPPRH